MVESEEEPLIEEDRRAVAASREYFRRNSEGCVSLKQIVAEGGFRFQPNVPPEVRAIEYPMTSP